jgi:hypothetical protein
MSSTGVNPIDNAEPIPGERVQVGFNVVIDGHLNPMILLPSWFEREGLLRTEEVEIANRDLRAGPTFLAFNTNGLPLSSRRRRSKSSPITRATSRSSGIWCRASSICSVTLR